MTEDELQAIKDIIVQASNNAIENYDWDKELIKYMEGL